MRDHVRARAATDQRQCAAPRGAVLAIVSSPPMSVMLRLMDVPSDDLFAELFAKQLGNAVRQRRHDRRRRAGDLEHDRDRVRDPPEDRRRLRAVARGPLLAAPGRRPAAAASGTPVGKLLAASLPVVGVNGTVRSIAVHTAGQRNCIAKTGTLDDVTNLAGYCQRPGHHKLAFALLIDGPENWSALVLEGQMIAAIARY